MNTAARALIATVAVVATTAIAAPASAQASTPAACLAASVQCGHTPSTYVRAIRKPSGPSCQFAGPFMTYRVAACKA